MPLRSRSSLRRTTRRPSRCAATLGLRVGRAYRGHGFPTGHGFPAGNGYFVGASYRELLGARFLGLTLGYSIDLAMPRRWTARAAADDADADLAARRSARPIP